MKQFMLKTATVLNRSENRQALLCTTAVWSDTNRFIDFEVREWELEEDGTVTDFCLFSSDYKRRMSDMGLEDMVMFGENWYCAPFELQRQYFHNIKAICPEFEEAEFGDIEYIGGVK